MSINVVIQVLEVLFHSSDEKACDEKLICTRIQNQGQQNCQVMSISLVCALQLKSRAKHSLKSESSINCSYYCNVDMMGQSLQSPCLYGQTL